ncbi:MAG: cation diffusion facilitator family transporter [Cellulomonadaceae bacterium]|nr:cation diffusion facilitator family transporter [Cellulomonadaceae bacterium]
MSAEERQPDGLSNRKRLTLAFAIAGVMVVVQTLGAAMTGSLSLLTRTADALSDLTGLGVALTAAVLADRPFDSRRPWGFRRLEVLAALGQALLLMGVSTYAAVEGIRRLIAPPEVASDDLLIFGLLGLAANIAVVAIMLGGRSGNLNMRVAFLDSLADTVTSLGIIAAAIIMATTGFQRADAIAALLVAALVLPRAVGILRQTWRILMEYPPDGLDLEKVREHLAEIDGVREIHDLRASTIATGLPVLSAHIVVDDEYFTDGRAATVMAKVKTCVAEHLPVAFEHSTIQLEPACGGESVGGGQPAGESFTSASAASTISRARASV